MQSGRSNTAVVGTKLVVQSQQVDRQRGGQLCAVVVDVAGLRGNRSTQFVNFGRQYDAFSIELISIRGKQPNRRFGALDPLHDLQLDVLELTLPPCERHEFLLQGLQLLGITDRARIQQLPITGGAVADLLDIRIRLALLKSEVRRDGLGRDDLVPQSGQSSLDVRERCPFGHRLVLVPQLAEPSVICLHLKKPQLHRGVGFHSLLPR